MPWKTIAIDGDAIGNLEFLSNYARTSSTKYELLDAKITSIKPAANPLWDSYDIESERGVATFTIRASLRRTMYEVLTIPQTERLEGKILCAHYLNGTLMGVTRKVEE